MDFGIFLNQYHTDEGDFEAHDLLEQAELIEEVGFDSVTVGERHVHEEGFVEPLTSLAAIAVRTETLELGTAAMLPGLYNPLHIAETIATIDELSGGRASFGAALGYRDREIEAFGVDMDERAPRLNESLTLLRRFWSGETVTHDGDFWSYDEAFVSPAPEEIPIWVGGHADIAIKRAAYRGNAWIASASSTTDDLREQIGDAARRGVREAGYTNAGTVEFLVEDSGASETHQNGGGEAADSDFYFMEVNTRIQVEHTATEEVTDIDVVRWQIRVAAGEELSFAQDDVGIEGHAIEYRINAENPAREFSPTPGPLETYDPPGSIGVRLDHAVNQGDEIGGEIGRASCRERV